MLTVRNGPDTAVCQAVAVIPDLKTLHLLQCSQCCFLQCSCVGLDHLDHAAKTSRMCVTSVCGMQVAQDAALALRLQAEEDHTEQVGLSTAAEAQAACAVGLPGGDQVAGGLLV